MEQEERNLKVGEKKDGYFGQMNLQSANEEVTFVWISFFF